MVGLESLREAEMSSDVTLSWHAEALAEVATIQRITSAEASMLNI
jgi:hypothetical protein